MYWKVTQEPFVEPEAQAVEGRFVLHRHTDAQGPHLDLRLEQDGYLMGWRIDGLDLDAEPWATEKAPHPTAWLDKDGDAVREDAGEYAWLSREDGERLLYLRGADEPRVLRFQRLGSVAPSVVRGVCEALAQTGADPHQAGALIVDGVRARSRAVERFCGLARELDGDAFVEDVWRKTLAGLALDEIHGHLRAYESRFDALYPPLPISRPEPLPEEEPHSRRGAKALGILRGEGTKGK